MLTAAQHALAKLFGNDTDPAWPDYTGVDARQLNVTFTATGPFRRLWLRPGAGGKYVLPLDDQGRATAMIAPGAYTLEWKGRTSSVREDYTFAITAPESVAWAPKLHSDLDGVIDRGHDMVVP